MKSMAAFPLTEMGPEFPLQSMSSLLTAVVKLCGCVGISAGVGMVNTGDVRRRLDAQTRECKKKASTSFKKKAWDK